MHSADALKTAFAGLLQAKVRTILTMLGIVIGISSVIILMSVGASAQDLLLAQVRGVGSNLVFVIPGGTGGSKMATPAAAQGIIIKTLVKQDVDALRRESSISRISGEVRGQARVVFENNDAPVLYQGVNADFFGIRNFQVSSGRIFNNDDVDSANHVAVIGSALTETLFGQLNPLGKTVRVRDVSFRIVGVLEKKGLGPFGIDQDNILLIPLSVAQKQLLGIEYFNSVTIEGGADYQSEFVKSRIIAVLRQNHHITDPAKDDFTVRTQEDSLALLGNITSIMTVFLAAIASISLIVGGIGIMNIMLVSVIERTREIGLRKAVGADSGDILQQFLFEAIMLTLVGGIIGIIFGATIVFLIYLVLIRVLETGWTFILPAQAVLLAVGVSVVTGLVFGIYPARQAARKSPIESLRYE